MLLFPLAAWALIKQNPNNPFVLLPAGWKVSYFAGGDNSNASLQGPAGQEIRFPPYGTGVEPADSVFARNPSALDLKTFIGGRPVETVLTSDGNLTVTFGWRKPHENASDAPVSFATKVTTARQTAVSLGIILSRLRAFERDPNRSQLPNRSPDTPPPVRKEPGNEGVEKLILPEGYTYICGMPARLVNDRLPASSPVPISKRPLLNLIEGVAMFATPGPTGWIESFPILDGYLSVTPWTNHRLYARFVPPNPLDRPTINVVFIANLDNPGAAVDAIFAALNYSKPPLIELIGDRKK